MVKAWTHIVIGNDLYNFLKAKKAEVRDTTGKKISFDELIRERFNFASAEVKEDDLNDERTSGKSDGGGISDIGGEEVNSSPGER
jgi:hypothetical protein